MKGSYIHLQIQCLKREIVELSEELLAMSYDDPDFELLEELKWKSENELDQLLAMDVVEQF